MVCKVLNLARADLNDGVNSDKRQHVVDNKRNYCLNPLHPKISMHILHTVFYTFPKVLSRRFCLTIKSMLIISFTLMTLMFDPGVIL